MKKITILGLALLMAISSIGRPVDPTVTRQIAAQYFSHPVDITPAGWSEMRVYADNGTRGFVVVATDDRVRPILAYSAKEHFDPSDMPAHVSEWYNGYRREIASLIQAGAVASSKVQQMWQQALTAKPVKSETYLMTTRWNQSPRYNNMCPYSPTDSAHAVTGCVATAQAQIMKYWNHPAKGYGVHGYKPPSFGYKEVTYDTLYDWDHMPDALNWSSTQEEIDAVAQLMYHVGVAVEMNYGVESSGAYVFAYGSYNLPSSERSLKERFRYSSLLRGIQKQYYTDTEWDSILRFEIDHLRPVLYSGRDDVSGHAFVIDGYDDQGMFHVNWGWGGWYDGYYSTDSLSPGAGGIGGNATYTFNLENGALINIQPSGGNDSIAVIAAVSEDEQKGSVSGNGTYVPYESGSIDVLATAHTGYRFDHWQSDYDANPVHIFVNGDYQDTAHFAALDPDSLGYCLAKMSTAWQDDEGSYTEWGIRIPAEQRNPRRQLDAVRVYLNTPGYYTLNIYLGDSITAENRVYNKNHDLTEDHGWVRLDLPSPIAVGDQETLWITFRFQSNEVFPASASIYTGVADGTWYKTSDGWVRFADMGNYYSWMIGALFSERNYRVTLHADGFVGDEHVSGGGLYAPGESCTLSSDYAGEPPFLYWDFGHGIHIESDPYTFTVTQDTVVTAIGTCIGIDPAEGEHLRATVEGHTLCIEGPGADDCRLYSIDGRLTGTGRRHTALLPGVYLLAAPGAAPQKIIVL